MLSLFFSWSFSQEKVKNYQIQLKGIPNPETITVYLKDSDEVFSVDKDGFLYSPFKEKDPKNLSFSYGNYVLEIIIAGRSQEYPMVIGENTPTLDEQTIIIAVKSQTIDTVNEKTKKLREVKVRAKKENNISSREVLLADQARLIPGTGGDILKGIANFPGVVLGGGFDATLYIRGGSARDVLYSFDDILIGDPYHLAGLYSVFSPIVIDRLLFYPSSFPTAFGNSQGAVLDIRSKKELDKEKVAWGLDINLIQASAYVSVPIKMPFGDGMNIKVSGRRTYFEGYLAILASIDDPALAVIADFNLIPYFYDYNVVYDWNIIDDHTVWFSALGAQDKLSINAEKFPVEDENGNTNQVNFALDSDELWDSQGLGYIFEPSEDIRYDVTLSHYKITDKFSIQNTVLQENIREYVRLIGNGKMPLSDLFRVDFGIEYYFQSTPIEIREFTGEYAYLNSPPDPSDGRTTADRFEDLAIAIASNAFITTEENILRNAFTAYGTAYLGWKGLDIGLGLRLGGQDVNQSLIWDPRLFLKYFPKDQVSVYANIGRYTQMPYVERVGEISGTPELKNQWGIHYALGTEFVLDVDVLKDFRFKFEGYYKDLRDQTLINPTYVDGLFSSYDDNPRFLDTALGRAYGAEALIRKRFSKGFFGWVAYAWGRAERREFKSQNVNPFDINTNGNAYKNQELIWVAFDEDIEHSLKFVLSWQPVKWFTTGVTFALNTGKPYTPLIVVTNEVYTITTTDGVITNGTPLIIIDDPEALKANRFPINYSIAVRFEFTFPIKKAEMSIYLDIQNVQFFWHENVDSYNYNYNIVRPTHPDYVATLTPGPYPGAYREPTFTGIPVLPLLGITVKY